MIGRGERGGWGGGGGARGGVAQERPVTGQYW